MDELNQLADKVRKFDHEGDSEMAHVSEDELMRRALELIAEGADNPAALACLGLSTQSNAGTRWYA